jgi:choice-of-anchor C domain-containing protein
MKTRSLAVAGAALFAAALGSAASANLITNGSFELPAPATTGSNGFLIIYGGAGDSTTLPGWTVTGNVDVIPSSYWQPDQGLTSLDMIGSPGLGEVSQTITGLTPGAIYGISFDLAANPDDYDGEAVTTKQLQLSVTDPSSVVAVTHLYQSTAGSATRTAMDYVGESISFTASASTETLSFAALESLNTPVGVTSATIACGPVLDNVDMEFLSGGSQGNPVPEPASLTLLAAGSLLLFRRRSAR